MKDKDKAKFKRTAANNNGSIQINIPPEIREHLNIQPGDTIKLQTEHSNQHGKYASFWNETVQTGERKQEQ